MLVFRPSNHSRRDVRITHIISYDQPFHTAVVMRQNVDINRPCTVPPRHVRRYSVHRYSLASSSRRLFLLAGLRRSSDQGDVEDWRWSQKVFCCFSRTISKAKRSMPSRCNGPKSAGKCVWTRHESVADWTRRRKRVHNFSPTD
jgi:hypothetical protein